MTYERLPDSHPSGRNPMFCVPEWDVPNLAYVVRVRGFYRSDPDVYFVCIGGYPRPAYGPIPCAEGAEDIRDSINAERARYCPVCNHPIPDSFCWRFNEPQGCGFAARKEQQP